MTEPSLLVSDSEHAVRRADREDARLTDERRTSRPRRWTLSNRWGYAQAAAVIALCLFASVVPSPLYSVYAQRWHFSLPPLPNASPRRQIAVLDPKSP